MHVQVMRKTLAIDTTLASTFRFILPGDITL
jgi:hypothetical protein